MVHRAAIRARMIGCLILTDYPEHAIWELIYMGVLPAARGRGWGAGDCSPCPVALPAGRREAASCWPWTRPMSPPCGCTRPPDFERGTGRRSLSEFSTRRHITERSEDDWPRRLSCIARGVTRLAWADRRAAAAAYPARGNEIMLLPGDVLRIPCFPGIERPCPAGR